LRGAPSVFHDPTTLLESALSPDTITLALPKTEWPYLEILMRITLALALGLLIGMERERRGKEAGLRTFGFVALFSAIGGTLSETFALASLALTALLAIFLNIQALLVTRTAELTTSTAMLVTSMAGILCGQGHTLTPAAVMVIAAALLAWKQPLSGFTAGLTENEVRSALLLAILAIVIYPALPKGAIGPWLLIEPRAAWINVILIAVIGFVNYVLWRLYGTKGTEVAGFLGGLVNSSVTVAELAGRVSQHPDHHIGTAYRSILFATAAMIVRNAGILIVLAPSVLISAVPPLFCMLAVCFGLIIATLRRRDQAAAPLLSTNVQLDLPFSLWVALKYGALFLLLHVAGVTTQRMFGDVGVYAVSLLGGLVSSASAVAAAASLAIKDTATPEVAAAGAIIATLASALVNLPLVVAAKHAQLTRRVSIAIGLIVAAGMIGVLATIRFMPYLRALTLQGD